MSEIEIRTEQSAVAAYQQSSIDRLQTWAAQAQAVSLIAADICSTSFAPAAYRGKPAEATAAILAGAELGLDPMASLRAFDSIQGVPAPKALTLRAVVQAAGHTVRVVESSPQRCIVEGRRKGDTEWQRVEWTIERAQLMPQYKSNPNWKTSPAQMLVARATSELCRWIAADALMGMPYSAEEISDTTGLQASAPTRAVTAADIVGHALAATAEQPSIDTITVDEARARIEAAESLDELDEVKRVCVAAGIRGADVLDAWNARLAALTDADENQP